MSTLSSKPVRRYTPVELASILVFIALALIVALTPLATNGVGSLNVLSDRPILLSSASNVVFAADLEYWDENCSHGWEADSTCSAIVARTQSCNTSVDSGYCAEYAHYLKRLAK
jgi:hypothetical protein